MNYYKRHLGDYARDTGHLTALEHGIYTLLLDWYYVNECPIPFEKAVRIARGNPEQTQMVLEEFFKMGENGWIHSRADREIQEYRAKSDRNREVGKLGGRPKKTQTVSKRNPDITLATSHKPLEEEKAKACAPPTGEAPPRNQPIPYQAIADAFNRNMEKLPKVRELNAKRKTMIRTAWQENAERRTPEFWTAYFEECASDSFLNGSGPYKNGHENWRPSFDYLLKGDVVTRVFEKALDRLERHG